MTEEDNLNLPFVPGIEGKTFGSKTEGYSHEAKVSEADSKCINALAKEMTEGGLKKFADPKTGKPMFVYEEDTRRTAMEAITTMKNVMIADLIETGHLNNINELFKKIDFVFRKYLTQQKNFWDSKNSSQKNQYLKSNGNFHTCILYGELDNDEIFYQKYLADKLNVYREIYEQLQLCLAEKRYFKRRKAGNIGFTIGEEEVKLENA